MSMTRWMTVTCAAAVVFSGCTESQIDPEMEIQLSGKVLKEDGQPLANTVLMMNRSANSSCVFSLFGGLDWKSMKTGTDGAFKEELLGVDTRAGDLARCFELKIPGTGTGNYGAASFIIQTEAVQVPPLQQWTGKPMVAADTDGVRVTYEGLTASQAGNSGSHSVTVRTKSDGYVWVSNDVSSPATLNDDLLEDAADLKATVSIRREVTLDKTTFSIRHDGDPVALPKRSRVPVSRGASCIYPEAPTPCALTDGDLSSKVALPNGTLSVAIQLPQPKVLRKAVVRNLTILAGLTSELVLEGSTDGTTWVLLADLREGLSVRSYYEVALSHPTALSQVRLRTAGSSNATDYDIDSLSELSLFE
ncbi:hypothetical protein ACN28E_17910 [Archangium lansingense]|uniref:hypothetical protein n=1 Tax=Archangium lansingense TaxID=2995310 RepID=UPI003B7A6C27